MSIFPSKDQKQARQEEKQAKLEAQQAQQSQQQRNALHAIGLDLRAHTMDELRRHNDADLAAVVGRMGGAGMVAFGAALQGNGESAVMLRGLKGLYDQNWVLIRQNEQIIRLLEQKADKD